MLLRARHVKSDRTTSFTLGCLLLLPDRGGRGGLHGERREVRRGERERADHRELHGERRRELRLEEGPLPPVPLPEPRQC